MLKNTQPKEIQSFKNIPNKENVVDKEPSEKTNIKNNLE